MRRGGRGNNLQAPWRRSNDPTLSSVHFKNWEACRFRRLTADAACSIAISIIIWNSRPEPSSGRHVPTNDLRSRKPGFVFPLYRHYRQFPNASDDLEGEVWRGGGAANRRGLRSHPLFNVRKTFYIEMKLGVPLKNFKFHIDTGSKNSWVLCKMSVSQPIIPNLGPNGMYQAKRGSSLKCIGEDGDVCKHLQYNLYEPCDPESQYQCLVCLSYADKSIYTGVYVNESLTVRMEDTSEKNVLSLFGCILKKVAPGESGPEPADGLIGLGNCKWTLVDQWSRMGLFSHNVLGLCLSEAVEQEWAGPVGYISLGIDLKEKFDDSNPVWSRLTQDADLPSYCTYAAILRHISVHDKSFSVYRSRSTGPLTGAQIVFDTGSDSTYLETDVYDPLLKMLHSYAIERGYVRANNNGRSVCWAPPEKARKHGEASRGYIPWTPDDRPSLQHLIIQPKDYLSWHTHERELCLEFFEDDP